VATVFVFVTYFNCFTSVLTLTGFWWFVHLLRCYQAQIWSFDRKLAKK